ncbi:hypothetical protein [Nodularia sp. NIES-3585]|nr:hypothetical protein [Nodularia sp. NIES-3585]
MKTKLVGVDKCFASYKPFSNCGTETETLTVNERLITGDRYLIFF